MSQPRRAQHLPWAGAALLAALPWAFDAPETAPAAALQSPEVRSTGTASGALAQEEEWANLDEAKGAAIEAIRSDDFERARKILGTLLIGDYLGRATGFLENGDPAGALLWTDRALDLDPRSEEALLAKGDGLLALANSMIAEGQGGAFVNGYFEDALRAFKRVDQLAAGQFGMARSAYMLNRALDSLSYAQAGFERLGESAPTPQQQATLARAAYLVFADEAQLSIDGAPSADPVRRAERYGMAEDALIQWTGLAPEDSESWSTLANFYLYESAASGDVQFTVRAREALESGLERLPDDTALLARVVQSARQGEGFGGSIAALERQLERAPESLEAEYLLARERFDLGLETFPGPDAEAAEFERSRETFASARDGFAEVQRLTDPNSARGGEALGWRIMAQNALGWVGYWSGDLAAAERDFLGTADINSDGLEWQIAGVLESGLRGLEFVMDGYNRDGDILETARIALLLHDLDPANATFANHAGLFSRDAASAVETSARAFCAASSGELESYAALRGIDAEELRGNLRSDLGVAEELLGTAAEKRLFREHAAEQLARAWELVENSTAAYLAAVELSPQDPAVLNDASVMFLYHLHRDIDQAEELLKRCLEVSDQLLSDEALPEAERAVIVERLGDAHENLGVLHWFYKQDAAAAREWFQKALEIGPYPRVVITAVYFPQIDAALAGEEPPAGLPLARDVLGWGAPCE